MRTTRKEQERRRLPRYRIKACVDISLKTIGTMGSYDFVTGNISRGGVFVEVGKESYPFNEQSILEVWLHVGEHQKDSIFFMAKLVHQQLGKGFGIRIIDISDEELDRLDAFINYYEQLHPESRVGEP